MTELERSVVGLVEDSDEDFALFSRVFAPQWELRRWRSGEQALDDFHADEARLAGLSVLVVDLHLTGIDGFEVIQRVREFPDGKHLPVCLLTGSRREEDRRRSLDVGADAYLVKPDEPARLRELPRLLAQLTTDRG